MVYVMFPHVPEQIHSQAQGQQCEERGILLPEGGIIIWEQ